MRLTPADEVLHSLWTPAPGDRVSMRPKGWWVHRSGTIVNVTGEMASVLADQPFAGMYLVRVSTLLRIE